MNCDTTSTLPPTASRSRFIFPFSSLKTRSPATLRAASSASSRAYASAPTPVAWKRPVPATTMLPVIRLAAPDARNSTTEAISSPNVLRKMLRSWPLAEQIAFFERERILAELDELLTDATAGAGDQRDLLRVAHLVLGRAILAHGDGTPRPRNRNR